MFYAAFLAEGIITLIGILCNCGVLSKSECNMGALISHRGSFVPLPLCGDHTV